MLIIFSFFLIFYVRVKVTSLTLMKFYTILYFVYKISGIPDQNATYSGNFPSAMRAIGFFLRILIFLFGYFIADLFYKACTYNAGRQCNQADSYNRNDSAYHFSCSGYWCYIAISQRRKGCNSSPE